RDLPERGLAHLRAQVGGAAGHVLVGGDRPGAGGQRGGPGPQPEGGEQVAAGQGKVVHDGAPSVSLWWCGGQGSGGRRRPPVPQPFSAPAARPPMMRRWARKKTASIGRATITVPAITGPQES